MSRELICGRPDVGHEKELSAIGARARLERPAGHSRAEWSQETVRQEKQWNGSF